MKKIKKVTDSKVAAALAVCILISGMLGILPTRAAPPYHVTLTASNFNLRILSASAENLSDPSHAMFSLQNGTPLWYSITISSNPSGMVPTSTNGPSDVVTSTFSSPIPLLPPAGVLPFDQSNNVFHFETLKLSVAFSGPSQQIQFDLSPFESHAVTLDIFTLLLQLLGEKNAGVQVGLLIPDNLKGIFNAAGTMKDFTALTNDYVSILHAIPDTTAMLVYAYTWAKDLVSLLTDANEQQVLTDILWKIMGKTIPRAAILKTVTSFAGVQFGLGMQGFMRDVSLVIATLLIQQSDPLVVLQTVTNTPRSKPAPTPTQPRPTPTQGSTPLPTPGYTPLPTPIATRRPTPSPTPIPKATPKK